MAVKRKVNKPIYCDVKPFSIWAAGLGFDGKESQMGETEPGAVRIKETGAPLGAYLTGAGNVNKGMIIKVYEEQKRNREEGGPVEGEFEIVTAGGTYRDHLSQYEKQTMTAKEVIGEIAPQLVKAGKLKRPVLCIFNSDLLTLYEPDAFTDLKDHEQELMNLSQTEREAVVKARLGQGRYREDLIDLWEGRCAVTEVKNEAVLRASHIKPWRECSNGERLDRFNGLLLIPNLDVLFDQHLISFEKDGSIRISHRLSEEEQVKLGISSRLRLRKLPSHTEKYLRPHREWFYSKEGL